MRWHSPFQEIHFVGKQRFAIAEKRENNAQADGGFGGCVRDDKNREDLAIHIAIQTREGHEIDVDSVQDQLDGHEHDDHVAAHQHANHANGEERETEHEIIFDGDHHTLRLAMTTAPIMATSNKIEAISKGN